MRKWSMWVIVCAVLCGCATRTIVTRQAIELPPSPKEVVIQDKPARPNLNVIYLDKPETDLSKRTACWSFSDVELIGNALYEWAAWGRTVEQIVQEHNKQAGPRTTQSLSIRPK